MMFKKILTAIAFAATTTLATTSANAGDEAHIFKFNDVAWSNAGLPGAEMAVLWGKEEDDTAVYAFRLQPGVAIPQHIHTNDYWGFAIQGKWAHIDKNGKESVTGQDAYARISAKDLHADRCMGPEVCINILDFVGKRDIIFPEASPKKD